MAIHDTIEKRKEDIEDGPGGSEGSGMGVAVAAIKVGKHRHSFCLSSLTNNIVFSSARELFFSAPFFTSSSIGFGICQKEHSGGCDAVVVVVVVVLVDGRMDGLAIDGMAKQLGRHAVSSASQVIGVAGRRSRPLPRPLPESLWILTSGGRVRRRW